MDSKFLINSIYEKNNDIFEQAEKRFMLNQDFILKNIKKLKIKTTKKLFLKKI